MLSTINRIDLIGLDEETAKKTLLDGVKLGRAKPTTPPGFPGTRSVLVEPRFPGALPPYWNVPYHRNRNFTGRKSLLSNLHAALTSGQYAALTQAIIGLGGVGKTQLALEYVYSYMDKYEIVWWVRSEELSTLAVDYVSLAKALHLPESNLADQNIIVNAVRRKFGQLKDWLLIFDNAQKSENIYAYLPQGGKGHVIITSRNQDWDVVAHEMPIDVFEEFEAIDFILKRAGENDPDSAKELAKELGYLPLALEQACAYIKTGKSISGYLELFRQRKTDLLKFPISRKDYDYTVATTWEISFERVKEEPGAGADLLNLCAFLAPDNIPKPLLAGGVEHLPEPLASAVADELKFDDAVAALMRYSLVTVADDSLSVHRLVQAVARDRLSDEEREGWAAAAARLVNEAFPYDSYDVRTWPECSLLLPHALAVAGHAEEQGDAPKATGRLLNQVGGYLYGRAEFDVAKSTYVRALMIGEKAYGPDHPNVAIRVNNLGSVLKDQGDLEGAKKHIERALKICQDRLGEDHPNTMKTRNNLDVVEREIGGKG
jgi:NB-ARC domain.